MITTRQTRAAFTFEQALAAYGSAIDGISQVAMSNLSADSKAKVLEFVTPEIARFQALAIGLAAR